MGFSGCHIPGHTGTGFKHRRVFNQKKLSPVNPFKATGSALKYDLKTNDKWTYVRITISVIVVALMVISAIYVLKIFSGVDLTT